MNRISLRQLRVAHGRSVVIDGFDLEVAAGEFLVLLGPSGCGKSTLLHAIAGLVELQAGQVLIGGRDVTRAEPADRGIAMVFQSYALYPSMTVEKNLSFGLRVRGMARAEVARRVRRAAELLRIESLLQRRPAQLSGGQRQRVAIGRALVREAGVFLLDEPLSSLDAQLRADLRREIKLLHARLGATVVYVTHDQVEAMTLATRIALMRDGRLLQSGSPREVYDRPASRFVAGFVGSPVMNFLEGTLEGDAGGQRFVLGPLALGLDAYGAQAPLPGRGEVVLGVRPEAISISPRGRWRGRVTMTEMLGAHQVAWLEVAGQALAAIAAPGDVLAPGADVAFDIDAATLSLFDPREGRRL